MHVADDAGALVHDVAQAIVAAARASISARSRFAIALSGGSTPRPVYELLATRYATEIEWDRTSVFLADERCVPPDHADSNYRMAREALLDRVPVPPAQVHPMYDGATPPETAAQDYEERLRAAFAGDVTFDLAVLGVGPDGHTASLFPGAPSLDERERWVLHVHAPPAFAVRDRLTLAPPALNASRELLFHVTGAAKRDAVAGALRGDRAIPAARLFGVRKTSWFLDSEAAGA